MGTQHVYDFAEFDCDGELVPLGQPFAVTAPTAASKRTKLSQAETLTASNVLSPVVDPSDDAKRQASSSRGNQACFLGILLVFFTPAEIKGCDRTA